MSIADKLILVSSSDPCTPLSLSPSHLDLYLRPTSIPLCANNMHPQQLLSRHSFNAGLALVLNKALSKARPRDPSHHPRIWLLLPLEPRQKHPHHHHPITRIQGKQTKNLSLPRGKFSTPIEILRKILIGKIYFFIFDGGGINK